MVILLLLLVIPLFPALAQDAFCHGPYRRMPIDTGIWDPYRSFDSGSGMNISVRSISRWPAFSNPDTLSQQPAELRRWEVTAVLYGYRLEPDSSLCLLLYDRDVDSSIIARIPNPDCPLVRRSRIHVAFDTLRRKIIDNLGMPGMTLVRLRQPRMVSITGYPFISDRRGGPGMAANGWEIQPVVALEFPGDYSLPERFTSKAMRRHLKTVKGDPTGAKAGSRMEHKFGPDGERYDPVTDGL